MFYTFTKATKPEFDAAFKAGQPVSIVKDPRWAAEHETFVGRGFTSASVADPYVDGPSRPGEAWRYWVADVATATPYGPVEYGHTAQPWRYYCDKCEEWQGWGDARDGVVEQRKNHIARHERINWTGYEVTGKYGTESGRRGVVVDGVPKKSGPNKGKVEVMWIGGSWTVAERIENLQRVEAVEVSAGDSSRFSSQAGLASIRGGAR
jgi:hypothetical protein